MKTRKKPMAAMVAALACIMALPTPAWATQPQENPKVTVNDSVVVFAGHEWWVVGDGTTGINQQPGNITLLAKEDVYGDSVFRQGHGAEFDGSQYDSENDMYYAANPDGRKLKSLSQLSLYEEFTEKDLERLSHYLAFD